MLRHPIAEFNLSSGRASRRSFRPQCETLEERIVPDATVADVPESFAPSSQGTADPRVVAQVQGLAAVVNVFTAELTQRTLEVAGSSDPFRGLDRAANLARLARNLRKIVQNLQAAEEKLVASQPANDHHFEFDDILFRAAAADFYVAANAAGHAGRDLVDNLAARGRAGLAIANAGLSVSNAANRLKPGVAAAQAELQQGFNAVSNFVAQERQALFGQ